MDMSGVMAYGEKKVMFCFVYFRLPNFFARRLLHQILLHVSHSQFARILGYSVQHGILVVARVAKLVL